MVVKITGIKESYFYCASRRNYLEVNTTGYRHIVFKICIKTLKIKTYSLTSQNKFSKR